MTSRHDVMTSCKHKNDNICELSKPETFRNKKRNHLSGTSTSWDRYSMFNDVMTSWRHFLTSFYHANTMAITKLSSATKEITETKMESALEHICRLRWRQFFSWRHVVILVTSWRHVMTWRHHASTYTMIAWNPSTEISTEIHVYHHFRTSTSWYGRNEFCDVMTSRHEVMISCKHKNDNIF